MKPISFMIVLALSVSVYAQKSRILFVGNSLTYTNNLPELVEKEAKTKGLKVQTTMIAFPNYALIDHLDDGEVQKRIRGGKYDFVIVQQGPSSQAEGREMLLDAGRKFRMLCEQNETTLVFFMVWPSISNFSTFEDVIQNHKDAANLNNALLCPVGEAWKDYFEKTDDSTLYRLDGFHPSRKGSRLAAEVIVKTLFGNG